MAEWANKLYEASDASSKKAKAFESPNSKKSKREKVILGIFVKTKILNSIKNSVYNILFR